MRNVGWHLYRLVLMQSVSRRCIFGVQERGLRDGHSAFSGACNAAVPDGLMDTHGRHHDADGLWCTVEERK